MKKVLLNSYMCSPARGSESSLGWNWSTSLARKGYEVWCFTNVEDREKIEAEHAKLNLPNLRFVFIDLPLGIDRRMLNISSKYIYLHYYLWKQKAMRMAIKLHAQHHFDVVHHISFASFQQGTYLWKLKDTRIIFGPVGGGQQALPELKSYFGEGWKTEVVRSLISKLTMRFSSNLRNTINKSDYILVTNADTENLVKETKFYKKEKTHLVFDNAVPELLRGIEYIEKPIQKKLNMLWVGRMLPRKGLGLVLHALSYLPDHVDYSLTIVGTGEQQPLIEGWMREYRIPASRIKLVGAIPFYEVAQYYRNSDLFLFCTLRDSCPAQLTEAMAFGLPVITLDIHGSAVMVPDDCGIKVKPTTKDETARAVAQAIVRFSSDRKLLRDCARNAYNYSKTNTWENKIENVTAKFY